MKHSNKSRFLAVLLALAMVFSMLPVTAFATDSATCTAITSADELTTGKYVLVAGNGYAPTVLDGSWILSEAVTAVDGAIESPAANLVWTITVDGSTVKLTDSNGTTIAPKGGNNNGVIAGDYNWTVTCEDGVFHFAGQGEDTVMLASNHGSDNKFRGYKVSTLTGSYASEYSADFTLYKVSGSVELPPEETEPTPAESPIAQDDRVVIYAPAYGKALSTEKTGNYNAGVDVTLEGETLTGYGETEIFTVIDNGDGTFSFAYEGQNLSMGDSYASMNLGDVHDKWELTDLGNGLYNIKNTGRGNYIEWYNKYSNWSTYGSSYAATDDQFQLSFYIVPEEVPAPAYTPIADAVAAESGEFTVRGVVTLVDGNNLYLQDETGGICVRMASKPTDVSLGDTIIGTGSKTVYNGLPQLGSGTYEKSSGLTLTAKETTIAALTAADICTYIKLSGVEVTEVYDNNGQYSTPNVTVKDADGNTIQIYKAVVAKSDGSTWDVKVGDKIDVCASVGVYKTTLQLRNTLSTEITPYVEPAEGGALTSADQFVTGTYVMVVEDGYAMGVLDGTWVSAVRPVIENGVVTDAMGGIWTLTVNGSNVQITDSNGVSIKPKGGNANGISSGSYDWAWSFDEATGTFTFAGQGADTVKLASNANEDPTYGGFHKFRGYKNTTISGNPATYPCNFTLYPITAQTPESNRPTAGAQVVLYNLDAEGVLAAQNDTLSIENALAEIADGSAVPGNGAVVFTVEEHDGYYRFFNETYGYLCSNGTGNNAFYSLEASDDADWTLHDGKSGGFFLESRTAKFNGKYSQYLEYYADSYKTYSMNNVTNYDIYEFFFYPVAETVTVSDGIVNVPTVVFDNLPTAYAGQDYEFTFTVDAPFGVANMEVSYLGYPHPGTVIDGVYRFVVGGDLLYGMDELVITVTGTDNKGIAFEGTATVAVQDEPVIDQVQPAPGTQTGENHRPVITATLINEGEAPVVTMTVNGEAVDAIYTASRFDPYKMEYTISNVTWTPETDLPEGRTTVTVTVTRADGKSVTKTWSFTVGEAQYQLYFGQLHSHTTYSDGSGSLETALEYIASLPESANVDFVAFTDHSNYFDSSSAVNPEGALYDMSLAGAASQEMWNTYKSAIAAFNEKHTDVIAIGGFEMTWSGGPGHINTFNTTGIVSRNNSTLNNKTADAGMKAYYSLLSRPEGVYSISQFNHPGSTFGTFSDFAYWDALIDTRIQLVEVGNGEGQIGAGGYYPSYEYYTMALDKGWHVAPTNNQDNHKGKWGNANEARDVILTDNFTEEGIYEAIRAMRMYATEDKNLEIGYTVNGMMMGSTIEEVPENLNIQVTVYDPDVSDSISKVEVIVNSGKVAYTWDDPADLADGALSCTIDPSYSYYYIRVTEGDGDLAVTAPVWVGETLKLGISSVETSTSTPVTGEELTISTTLFNSESADAAINALVYSIGDEIIGTDTTTYFLSGSGNFTVNFAYTPEIAKLTTITVTAYVNMEGTDYEFSMDIQLDVQDASKLVYIGIDASHYNEYVNGNYKDSMGNFSNLAAGYSVRTVTLYTSEDLIAACANPKYVALILTAPSRRSAEAQNADPLKIYTEEEIAAIKAFNANGGTVILAGWSDHYENYPDVASIVNMKDYEHMAATQNALLEALGSSLRIGDDATYDDDYNGGQAYRLYFNTYGESFLTEGIEVDPEHPHDRMYTEVFSHYGGASVYTVDGTLPETVSPIVFGHSGTYSVDVDGDGLGGASMYKYEVAEGDSRLMIMASEQLEGQGLIIVSGAAFMSNFEVQATIEDSGAEKNYSNYKVCENLLAYLNPATISTIAEVRAETQVGVKFTIEGVVTSNASGYDKATAFFDCIYVQDATGGICCFPVAGNYKIGDLVRITGTTEFYQGEPELQVTEIEVIGEAEVTATSVTAAQINDRSVEGLLVTLTGTVESFELANGLVQTIMVRDAAGNVARVFIDGYITTDADVANLTVGCAITVTGLASYDDTFNAPEGPFPRIRVRNRADVICSEAGNPNPFTDVAEDMFYYDAVLWAVSQDITSGTSATTFSPNGLCTRAQIVTFIWRAKGCPAPQSTANPFVDVKESDYFYEAVLWAVEEGITKGTSPVTFSPNATCTRAQAMTFLYRAYGAEISVDEIPFTDIDADSYYYDAVLWGVEAGVTSGMSATAFGPNVNCSRGHIITFLYRLLSK